MIDACGAPVGADFRRRLDQVAFGVDLVNEAEPDSSLAPLFEGRQHPLGPHRWFRPGPTAADVSDLCSLWHCRRLWVPHYVPCVSTFLPPLAPSALPDFHAPMGALTPAGTSYSGVASALSCLLSAPTRTAGQVGWGVARPSATRSPEPTALNPAGLSCSRQRICRPFRLQPPAALPGGVSGCYHPGLPRLPVVPTVRHPVVQVLGVSWASPFTRRLARTAGRIEFACATDWTFTWGCSPPPLTRTQLPWVTGPQTRRGKVFHLAGSLLSKAHGCGGRRRFSFFSSLSASKEIRKRAKAAATAALQSTPADHSVRDSYKVFLL